MWSGLGLNRFRETEALAGASSCLEMTGLGWLIS